MPCSDINGNTACSVEGPKGSSTPFHVPVNAVYAGLQVNVLVIRDQTSLGEIRVITRMNQPAFNTAYFAAIGLFAIAGLAIDGTAKYSDRRHAQNAADAAALAGALSLGKEEPDWKLKALDVADGNGYDRRPAIANKPIAANTIRIKA